MALHSNKVVMILMALALLTSCGTDDGLSNDSCAASADRIIFLTSASYTGAEIGGVSGADAKCNSDLNKPACGGTFKAMISDGTTRDPGAGGGQVGWVMLPNTTYARKDGTKILTTNSTGILNVGSLTNAVSTLNKTVWLGIANTFSAGDDCSDWTSNSGTARFGSSNLTTNPHWFSNFPAISCATKSHLYCVEQ